VAAGKLHAIAGVACKTDNCGFNFLTVLFRPFDGRYLRHRVFPSRKLGFEFRLMFGCAHTWLRGATFIRLPIRFKHNLAL
jgi:hypothetical protein